MQKIYGFGEPTNGEVINITNINMRFILKKFPNCRRTEKQFNMDAHPPLRG